MRPGGRSERARWRSTIIAVALFLALALIGVLNHEMWRDEIEIWLIARDSAGPGELLENMATEGHPSLWYLLNFLLARFTDDPLAMQLLTVFLSAGAVLIFLRHAPFPLTVRLASVFGYFLLYEYTVISRNYVLVVLLGFAACAALVRRGRLSWFSAALLFLLANAHLYGTIFAGLIGLLAVLRPRASEAGEAGRTRAFAAGPALLVSAGAVLGFGHTLLQSLAIGEAHAGAYRPGYDLPWVLSCLGTVTDGFLPMPDPTAAHTWNSHVLGLMPAGVASWVSAVAGLTLLAGCVGVEPRLR